MSSPAFSISRMYQGFSFIFIIVFPSFLEFLVSDLHHFGVSRAKPPKLLISHSFDNLMNLLVGFYVLYFPDKPGLR